MKKWLALGLVAVILALAALPALAQDNDPQLAELEALYRQLTDIKKKIADVRVEMGQITAEQGTAIKERADEHYNWLKENSFRCPGCGLGGGWRRGPGGGGRFGGGRQK
ncbi:MAG: DUF2680 domain-containing protein [bacterium]|jgi:hypothetical protein|nr:DUF2680 domain-containing protein [Bacillota bacterium]